MADIIAQLLPVTLLILRHSALVLLLSSQKRRFGLPVHTVMAEGEGWDGWIWGTAVRVRPRKLNNPENPSSGHGLISDFVGTAHRRIFSTDFSTERNTPLEIPVAEI